MSGSDYEANSGYIRRRARRLRDSGYDGVQPSYAEYVSLAPATPLGHFTVSVSTSPVGLPGIPANCRRVTLQPVGGDLTFRDDGGAPDASNGLIIYDGIIFIYDTDPDANFLMWSGAGTVVRGAYYG